MKVFLTGLRRPESFTREWFDCVSGIFHENRGAHQIVPTWREADRILLLYGSDYVWGLNAEEKKMIREKSEEIYVWSGSDQPALLFPGLYANLSRSSRDQGRLRSYCFQTFNSTLEKKRLEGLRKKWSVSFSGAPTSPIRKRLLKMNCIRNDVLIENTESHQEWNPTQPEWMERKERYSQNLLQSRFVLCPRGAGIGSIRFFETLQAGSVPVVIADKYLFPEGPEWEKCILRIPEGKIERWERELEEHLTRAEAMGVAARQTWEKWFAPQVWFQRLMEGCDQIRGSRVETERIRQRLWFLQRISYRQKTEIPKILREIKRKIRR